MCWFCEPPWTASLIINGAIVPGAELWAALKWLVSSHSEAERRYLTRGVYAVSIHRKELAVLWVFWSICILAPGTTPTPPSSKIDYCLSNMDVATSCFHITTLLTFSAAVALYSGINSTTEVSISKQVPFSKTVPRLPHSTPLVKYQTSVCQL